MSENNLKIAFFGTPDLCIPILERLKASSYMPSLIITNPDRPVGRKQIITPSPVKIWGEENDIVVLQPEKLDEEFYLKLKTYNLNLSIVVAYGKIIPEKIINIPEFGTLNIHYSLLPKYRGATPVESAILSGDTETGVTIQKMAYELDAGDILSLEKHPIVSNITSTDLRDELNKIGAELLIQIIPKLINREIIPQKQNPSLVTKCGKIKKSDGEVNLDEMNDQELWNRYRAYYGWPGIFYFPVTNLGQVSEKRVKITEAIFEDGKFIIKKIIPEGKSEITF